MPKTTIIRKRNTTVVIEAYAEVTASPTGPLGKWGTEFRRRLEKNTRDFAPMNRRPRWKHYGPRLKDTFGGAIRHNPVKGRVDFAVGSSADHALYVDQGTGVFNGGAPWRAKILPPWRRGEGSLYEASWIAGRRRVKPVWIKGQKPQHFMQRGLDRTMKSMLNRSYQLPDDPRMAKMAATAPRSLLSFLGGTPNNGAFRGELAQWRAWRDKAWGSGRELGDKGARKRRRETKGRNAQRNVRREYVDYGPPSEESLKRYRERRNERRRENARRYRDRVKSGYNRKPDRSLSQDRARERATITAQLRKTYPVVDYQGFLDGKFVFSVKDRETRQFRTLRVTPKTTAKGRRRVRGW